MSDVVKPLVTRPTAIQIDGAQADLLTQIEDKP